MCQDIGVEAATERDLGSKVVLGWEQRATQSLVQDLVEAASASLSSRHGVHRRKINWGWKRWERTSQRNKGRD